MTMDPDDETRDVEQEYGRDDLEAVADHKSKAVDRPPLATIAP